MITLAMDASTYAGDVAVLDGSELLAEESVAMKGAEHERLMPAVSACLGRANVNVSAIGRVVCGSGPGSFTSLRIAGAIAKGVATGVRCPLYAVPSMALLLGGTALPPARYLVAIDALRAEFYVGLYEIQAAASVVQLERARLVPASDVAGLCEELGVALVSPSELPGAIRANPRARAAARLESLLSNGPVDIASWEPSYGRLAEAQVRWESAHGRPLPAG